MGVGGGLEDEFKLEQKINCDKSEWERALSHDKQHRHMCLEAPR